MQVRYRCIFWLGILTYDKSPNSSVHSEVTLYYFASKQMRKDWLTISLLLIHTMWAFHICFNMYSNRPTNCYETFLIGCSFLSNISFPSNHHFISISSFISHNFSCITTTDKYLNISKPTLLALTHTYSAFSL
jgi:hypothetical protein